MIYLLELNLTINYEELNLTFILHYLKIGFDIKIKLNGINELIEEKVFKK